MRSIYQATCKGQVNESQIAQCSLRLEFMRYGNKKSCPVGARFRTSNRQVNDAIAHYIRNTAVFVPTIKKILKNNSIRGILTRTPIDWRAEWPGICRCTETGGSKTVELVTLSRSQRTNSCLSPNVDSAKTGAFLNLRRNRYSYLFKEFAGGSQSETLC